MTFLKPSLSLQIINLTNVARQPIMGSVRQKCVSLLSVILLEIATPLKYSTPFLFPLVEIKARLSMPYH